MCKKQGIFINLVVNSTLCLPLVSVAPSDFAQFAINSFLQTKFSSLFYLLKSFPHRIMRDFLFVCTRLTGLEHWDRGFECHCQNGCN